MSASDTLGHQDVLYTWLVCHRSSLETVDLRLLYAQGCWHTVKTGVGNFPHMSVRGDNNTTPISNDGLARIGPMVRP